MIAPQAAPPWTAARVVGRERVCEPEPQVLEQLDHEDHWPYAQSTGQDWALHCWVCLVVPQALPPKVGVVVVVRERSVEPVPQDLVQVAQAVQAVCTQSTGQLAELQSRVLARTPQVLPP